MSTCPSTMSGLQVTFMIVGMAFVVRRIMAFVTWSWKVRNKTLQQILREWVG
jgi:hypothetical protein